MIEVTIRNHLTGILSVPVYYEHPSTAAGTYVVVEKTGSSRENHLVASTFAIQSYASSLYEAILLNEQVKAAMDSLVELKEIARSELNTDYNFTDTETKRYRYQAVYDINHY